MSFFEDEDPFEDVIRSFFGGANPSRRKYSQREKLSKNFIDTKDHVFFVLDLSTIQKIEIEIKNKIISERFEEKGNKRKILEIKGNKGEIFEYILPKNIEKKKFNWTFKNGILEVTFEK